jgi:hypothetical protein
MTIEYNQDLTREFQICLNGSEFIQEKVDWAAQEKTRHNLNPFLNKIIDYQDKGWELQSIQALANGIGAPSHFAYLKRKKPEE